MDKPFKFGNVSVNTPLPNEKERKPKKIKPVKKEIENASDAFYCKDRIKHHHFLCQNEKCICKYKKVIPDDVVLEINKSIIQNYFSKREIDDYSSTMLNLEWKTSKLKNRYTSRVYPFINQCKFVYGLDLIIKRKKIEKVNTATQARRCKDRIKSTNCSCKGCIIIENGEEKKYRCYYSYCTEDQLNREAMREWFLKKLDIKKLSHWDKIILITNWTSLSTKQEKMLFDFIKKYISKVNKQTKP